MSKPKPMNIHQREKALLELIEDAKELGFNPNLIKRYENQINKIQEEIKADKERLKSNINERGRE